MGPTLDGTSPTTNAFLNDSPTSIEPSDDFPRNVVLSFLPTLLGYEMASNVDLRKVDPSKIPSRTLRWIRQFERMCQETKEELKKEHPVRNDIFHTGHLCGRVREKLNRVPIANKEERPDEVKHQGVLRRDLYTRMLEPSTDPDRPAEAFAVRNDKGWTDMGRSMGTAYKDYLRSEWNEEERQVEGLSREDDLAKSPTDSTPAIASELAQSSSEETPLMVAQPIASPPQTSDLSPGPSVQPYRPSRNRRTASPALTEWVITVPVWPHGCTNPLVKSTSPSAPNNSHVHDALSLAFRYSQSHEASQDTNFARGAMDMTFAITNARISGIKLQLVPQKGGSSARSRNDADNGTERYCDAVEYQNYHDESIWSQHIDLQDAPGEVYSIPDRLSDLRRMVDAMMSKNSRVPCTLGEESEFD